MFGWVTNADAVMTALAGVGQERVANAMVSLLPSIASTLSLPNFFAGRDQAAAALNVIAPVPPFFLRGRTVISISWSNAVSIRISRSSEKP